LKKDWQWWFEREPLWTNVGHFPMTAERSNRIAQVL
jgi:hypothetical protein